MDSHGTQTAFDSHDEQGPDQENVYVNTAYDDVDLIDDKADDDGADHEKTNGTTKTIIDAQQDENYDNPPFGWFGIRPRFIQVIITSSAWSYTLTKNGSE